MAPINRGFLVAGILTVIGTLVLALVYVGNDEGTLTNVGWRMFGAVVIGLVLAQVVSRSPSTSPRPRPAPVREIAEAARTGPATTVLSGISSGLESSVWAIVAIAGAIGDGHRPRRRQHPVHPLPGRPHRHGHAGHHRRGRLRGHVRPGRRQRRRHRRDVGRVPRRARADHGEPRRGRQHHQGRHQGLRHRLGGHRRGRAVRLVHRDDRQRARARRHRVGALQQPAHADQRRRSEDRSSVCSSAARSRSCSARSPSAPSAAPPASSCRRSATSSPTARS